MAAGGAARVQGTQGVSRRGWHGMARGAARNGARGYTAAPCGGLQHSVRRGVSSSEREGGRGERERELEREQKRRESKRKRRE